MKTLPRCYGIIPSRYGSRRFEGKPLAMILGKPMFWHVYNRACRCPALQKVVMATDDPRIFKAAEDLDVPVVMTRTDHVSGTDRVLEAALILQVEPDAVVVNIQGDEPALEPNMLSQLVEPFQSPEVVVTTLARKISIAESQNHDRVKVVFDKQGKSLYFSRAPIPHHRDGGGDLFYGHIGLYAFRMNVLEQFVRIGPSRLENTEKLEQLRLLESGIPIHVAVTEHHSIGVDRPEDLKIIEKILGGL